MRSIFIRLSLVCLFSTPIILKAQAPEIDIQGGDPWQSIADGDGTPSVEDGTDFGNVELDGGIESHSFKIINEGTADLIITGLGPFSGEFYTWIKRTPFTIAPGDSTHLTYYFDPAGNGLRTGAFYLDSNDSDEGTYTFALQGIGGDPDIDVQGGDPYQSILCGDTTPSMDDGTDYGSVVVSGGYMDHPFRIVNVGYDTLRLSVLPTDTGPNQDDFYDPSVIWRIFPLLHGDVLTFSYRFDPSASGVRTTTLTIMTNDPDEGTFSFTLRGTGGFPEMGVQGNGVSIPDGGGHSMDNGTAYGNVYIGSSDIHTFTIANTGDADLELTGSPRVSVGGTHASDFTVSLQPAAIVGPGGATSEFSIEFQPSAPGQRLANLTIENNDADENLYDIGLDGWGRIEFNFINGARASLNFTQSQPTPPVNNWPMGQFSLSAGTDGVLNSVIVDLSGTYSGLAGAKPFRIYASDTNDFSTASAKGSDAAASGGSVTVEVNDAVSTSTRYYWLTVDLGEGAGGTITGTISDASGIIVYDGEPGSASKYGPLSTGSDVSLPVEMVSFSVHPENGSVVLEWMTECEVDHLGFIIERSDDNQTSWRVIASCENNDMLRGQGNSSSQTKYKYVDVQVEPGHGYYYRLIDINVLGDTKTYPSIFIQLVGLPKETRFEKPYPNPFNPQTYISYDLAEETQVEITVFDMLGHTIKELYNGHQLAGSYHVYWNGTDENGMKVSSGIYVICMQTEIVKEIQKVMFVK
ncbi:choice-of-anchor D domain-containing protein [bacterium]|nr:choice-of-anchor D domain-containing protein [bacterium]